MKNLLYHIKAFLLNILGDIRIFKWPLFIIYQPTTFKCKSQEYRNAVTLLKPGDLVFRRYFNYMDSFFIPGTYSHGSIYIGERTIIHSIAEGVQEIDILDFLRCDDFCILRPSSGQEEAIKRAKSILGKEYDFNFESDDKRFYCFEVCAYCYKELNVKLLSDKVFGFIPSFPAYIAKSFFTNENFKLIYTTIQEQNK
jgi:hypothetical protein